ncbi:MAG: hypothetical protein NC127_09340 [Muribaculum sp.]|nr:hypothetical protein [Muribaculum sp.]
METKDFTARANELYAQLRQIGDETRQIITDFVAKQGGSYTINIDEDDHAWVGEEIYATALKFDKCGNVLVFNSGQYSEYLHDMDDYNILDLASYIISL